MYLSSLTLWAWIIRILKLKGVSGIILNNSFLMVNQSIFENSTFKKKKELNVQPLRAYIQKEDLGL